MTELFSLFLYMEHIKIYADAWKQIINISAYMEVAISTLKACAHTNVQGARHCAAPSWNLCAPWLQDSVILMFNVSMCYGCV